MPASIFISHSAKDLEGREYLRSLVNGLGEDYEVWVDEKRLKGGDHWGLVIANEMAECHGAVALFSSNALESEYFRYEVSNLFARWMREGHGRVAGGADRFRFCPIVVPPMTVDGIKAARFVSAAYMGLVNWIVPASPEDALTRVRQVFAGLEGWDSPLRDLERTVESILGEVGTSDFSGPADVAQFGLDLGPAKVSAERLARLYMRCSIDSLCASLARLQNLLGDERVQRLFELLAPSWVSFEAGCRFESYLCVTGRAPADRFAIISGEYAEFTPLMYLMRARRRGRKYSHLVAVNPPAVGDLSQAWLQEEIENELAHYIGERFKDPRFKAEAKNLARLHAAIAARDRQASEPLLKRFIGMLVAGGGAVLVAVPAGPADFDLVESVSAAPALQQVTIVALRGWGHPPPGERPQVILPDVSQGYEDLAYGAFVGFTLP